MKKFFSPLFIGVSEDFGLAIFFAIFFIAKSHSTFALANKLQM